MAKRDIVWDLSEIFPSISDPSVLNAINELTKWTERFASEYRGKLNGLPAKVLLKAIRDFEEYCIKLDRITAFSYLQFNANMTSPEVQSLYETVNKVKAELDKLMAFFNIEMGRLIGRKPELINEPVLHSYRHYFERLRREVPHQLSEVQEKLIIEKDQFGIKAWQGLQGKWLNTKKFALIIEGKKKTLSFSEAVGLLSDPNRSTRLSAAKSILGQLGKDGEIYASALRNICNDWLSICDRRKYDSPMEASLIINDIDQQIINNLLTTIETHTSIYHRYLRLKAKILKLPKLGGHDIGAPIPDAPNTKFEYDTAKELVVDAYNRFDEDYASAAKDMLARNHVDVTPRLGKRNGAFSWDWLEGKSAFVLMNFNERLNDVYVLAHELGHATHTYLYTRSQTPLNYGGVSGWDSKFPATTAETASIFGELLLTSLLLTRSKSKQEKKALLCMVLDSASANSFGVAARALFELSLYDAIKRGEFLDYKTTSRYWVDARDKISGDAVEWPSEMEAAWTPTPHYFFSNYRFYNYPYAYAQLFVYALYQKYLEEGKSFVPKFKKALSAGCSVSPLEIGKIVGLDIADSHFWELGLKQYERFLEELGKVV